MWSLLVIRWLVLGVLFCGQDAEEFNTDGSSRRLVDEAGASFINNENEVHPRDQASRMTFVIKPSDKQALVGETVTLECSVEGPPGHVFEWVKNGQDSLPRNARFTIHPSGSLIIRDVAFEDRGIYACTAHSYLETISASAGLVVHAQPTFIEVPRDTEVVEGITMEITCRARGYPKPTIEWSHDDVLQPTTSRQHLVQLEDGTRLGVAHARSRADSGQYRCRAHNAAGSISSTATVTVKTKEPLVINNRPRNVRSGLYEEVQFICTAVGDPSPQTRWVKNDVTRLRQSNKYTITDNALVVHDVALEDMGRYTCIAYNEYESRAASALLEVDEQDLIRNNFGVGERELNTSVINARRDVDRVISPVTVTPRRGPQQRPRGRTPSDLLALFRLPSASALEITRARETFEQALDNILTDVRMKSVYHPRVNFSLETVLSDQQLRNLAQLSGCFNHRTEVTCENTCFHSKYRTYDGTCNNLENQLWGASLTALERLLPSRYENGISEPLGWNRERRYNGLPLPSARAVSTKILATNEVKEDKEHTLMLMQWGQFLDHDMDFTPIVATTSQITEGQHCNETCINRRPCFPIVVPVDDPRIHRGQCLGFTRSSAICGSGMTSVFGHRITAREQLNQITSFIDASNVYGSTTEDAESLRLLNNDVGLLKDGITPRNGQSFLPYDRTAPIDCQIDPTRAHIPCFRAGDHRANEQLGLLTLHTVFMRHHNRLATELRFQNGHWSGDTIYHETRKIVGAQMQHITYTHWLPKILGPVGMRRLGNYTGYDPSVPPSIINSFSTAAFRFGHSLIPPVVYRLDHYFQPSPFGNLPLHEAFFAPYRLVEEGGLDPLLRGLYHVGVKKTETDHIMNMELTERLFRLAHQIALDLGALNIQRGRDHGLPSYNAYREHCGYKRAKSFRDLAGEIQNERVLQNLAEVYGHPDNIDLIIGGLTEDAVEGSKVGPTFMCIMVEQFRRLRAGDRFWYENPDTFKQTQLSAIKKTTLAGIICSNHDGTIDQINDDVFKKLNNVDLYKTCAQIKKLDLLPWKECHLSGTSGIFTRGNNFEHGFTRAGNATGSRSDDDKMVEKMLMEKQSQIDAMEERLNILETEMKEMHGLMDKMKRRRKKVNRPRRVRTG